MSNWSAADESQVISASITRGIQLITATESYCFDPITRIFDISFLAVHIDDQSKRYYDGKLDPAQDSSIAVAAVEGILALWYGSICVTDGYLENFIALLSDYVDNFLYTLLYSKVAMFLYIDAAF
jgi:hypothetical protein